MPFIPSFLSSFPPLFIYLFVYSTRVHIWVWVIVLPLDGTPAIPDVYLKDRSNPILLWVPLLSTYLIYSQFVVLRCAHFIFNGNLEGHMLTWPWQRGEPLTFLSTHKNYITHLTILMLRETIKVNCAKKKSVQCKTALFWSKGCQTHMIRHGSLCSLWEIWCMKSLRLRIDIPIDEERYPKSHNFTKKSKHLDISNAFLSLMKNLYLDSNNFKVDFNLLWRSPDNTNSTFWPSLMGKSWTAEKLRSFISHAQNP